MSNQNNTPNQEIDLLLFFSAIGKMFKSFFVGIKKIFLYFLNLFLIFLIFLKRNVIYLSIGMIAGLVFAFIFKDKYEKVYTAEAIVKTNFGSGPAFENKINSLNNIIQAKDFDKLAQILKLDKNDAQSIRNFEVESQINDIQLIQEYENYLTQLDTTVYKFIKFKDFKKSINNNPELYAYKKLKIFSTEQDIFYKLNSTITSILEDHTDLLARKKEYQELLSTEKQENLRSLKEMDTMRKVWNQMYLDMGKQAGGNTNVIVSSDKVRGPEGPYNMFYSREFVLKNFSKTINNLTNNQEMIMLISAFPKYGSQGNMLEYNPYLKYPFLGFLTILIILSLINFYRYLIKYEKEKLNK